MSPPPHLHLVVDNDAPLRLGVVAAQFGLTAAALRTEAKRGRLVISRVAGKVLSHYGHLAPDYQDEAARAIGRKA